MGKGIYMSEIKKKRIHLIGNAHLDPVWLWQWQEGFAEIKATFRSALNRMKEFEDFKFTSACSAYYMWIEKSDKAMFEEIKQRVEEGRWCIVGGWFIQPDCNLPSGESFARQGLISQRFFKEKFGVTANVGYNVDSFGHNGNIPKILKNSGMDSYVFMRPMPDEKELPQSLFEWQSMDGSRVTAYRIHETYRIMMENFSVFEDIAELDGDTPVMAFYGVGNHGGGPTIELIEKMHSKLDERYVYSTPAEYFKEVENLTLPVVKDDLQFHAKGCYSACSQVKADNRRAENSLIEAERFSVLSKELMKTQYPESELFRAWENVLFNQFHDILGGCSIKDAYMDASWSYGEALNTASQLTNFAMQQISWNIDTSSGEELDGARKGFICVNEQAEELGMPVVVFNALPFAVERVVQLHCLAAGITTDDGTCVPVQRVRGPLTFTNIDSMHETAFVAKVPALGYRVYRIHCVPNEFNNPFTCTDKSIENEKIKLVLNSKTGEIASVVLKETGKELLSEDSRTIFADETDSDIWAHGIKEFKNVVGVCSKGRVKLIEKGPVRATIRSTMKLFDTEIIRDYSIERGRCCIDIKAKINFNEKHKMLKFSIPASVTAPRAYAKIPFGFIERPVDGTEQACGEWAAVCDKDGGIVVANRDKYSFDVDKNVISLTVLRGAIYADHTYGKDEFRDEFCEYTDQGIHEFSYSISPFESVTRAEREGQVINSPCRYIMETFHKGDLKTEYSGIELSEENIAVTALKKYEDGDSWILRCYETEDKDTTVDISLFETKWTTRFLHSQVKTFIVGNGKVTETDFIEWKH